MYNPESITKIMEKENMGEKEITPDIEKQKEIIIFMSEKDAKIFGETGLVLEIKAKEEFLKKVAGGEITREDFKELLKLEEISTGIHPGKPALLFREISEDKQVEKHIERMIARLVLNDANAYEEIDARNVEEFLKKYPEPFSFEEDIQSFLEEINKVNKPEKYKEYLEAKEKLMQVAYGKKYEYYNQIKLLEKEAGKNYPDAVFEKALKEKDDTVIEKMLKREFKRCLYIADLQLDNGILLNRNVLYDDTYQKLRKNNTIIKLILKCIKEEAKESGKERSGTHYGSKLLAWEDEALDEYMEKKNIKREAV
ncbi:MAG TPA: hypothetical protein P5232_02125 [Candidatus Moranbacteria bacterium]|nr:hypothetical protein [Candidatus Moranbacteria bacterium]